MNSMIIECTNKFSAVVILLGMTLSFAANAIDDDDAKEVGSEIFYTVVGSTPFIGTALAPILSIFLSGPSEAEIVKEELIQYIDSTMRDYAQADIDGTIKGHEPTLITISRLMKFGNMAQARMELVQLKGDLITAATRFEAALEKYQTDRYLAAFGALLLMRGIVAEKLVDIYKLEGDFKTFMATKNERTNFANMAMSVEVAIKASGKRRYAQIGPVVKGEVLPNGLKVVRGNDGEDRYVADFVQMPPRFFDGRLNEWVEAGANTNYGKPDGPVYWTEYSVYKKEAEYKIKRLWKKTLSDPLNALYKRIHYFNY